MQHHLRLVPRGRQPRASRPSAAALCALLLCALAAGQARAGLDSRQSEGIAVAPAADARVPCSQLSLLQPFAGSVAIHGNCR